MLTAESVGGNEPMSGVHPLRRNATMSERIWGLDWSKELPWQFEGATLEHGSFEDALPFMAEHFGTIFGTHEERFLVEKMTEAKRRFCEELDVFVFRADGKTVGVATAHPTDWSTYYVRTFAVLPEYRERRWCGDWTTRLCEPLRKVGCARLECDCSSANSPMMRMVVSVGCLCTGTASSERWGQVLRFTRFLNDDAEKAFRRQFINVPNFGRNPQP